MRKALIAVAVFGVLIVGFALGSTQGTVQDIPAPTEMSYEESGNDPLYEEPTPSEENELGENQAKKLYQETIAEVEAKLGELPIDDSVPSGEFGYVSYTIKEEALSEASDALMDRQMKEDSEVQDKYSECDNLPMNTDTEMAAYDSCYAEVEQEYDALIKKHDEENDWLSARQEQLWNEGQ